MRSLKEITSLKLTKKQRKKLIAKGKLRDSFELWVEYELD